MKAPYRIAFLVILLLIGSASAFLSDEMLPTIDIAWNSEDGSVQGQWSTDLENLGAVTPNGGDELLIEGGWQRSWCDMTWTMIVDPDPFIDSVFVAKNLLSQVQTFTVTVSQPVSISITPTSLMGGSVQGGLSDSDGSGSATVATVSGSPLYNGMIDGAGVFPIYNDPPGYSWSVAQQYGSANIPQVNLLPPSTPGPALTSTIGLQYVFTLTPGDTATISGVFVVVPEPTTMALLGLGAMALIRKK